MARQLRGSDVTIVIPTIRGREDMLARAIRSVGTQIVKPADVIIEVDDKRAGAAATRNAAMERVHTELVAWLDDDDELLPNHVKVLTRAMNHQGGGMTGPDMVYSYAEFVGGRDPLACCRHGNLVAEPLDVPWGPEARAHLDSRSGVTCPHCGYERGNFIPITYMVRADLVRQVGGFPEPYSMPEVGKSGDCEDYLLLLRLLDAGARFFHVPARTWRYHFHGANTGGRGADRLHELEQR
jgi:GT2 family glycosyltransferase